MRDTGSPAGHIVKLIFQTGRVVKTNIFLEKTLKERRNQSPTFIGSEPVLVHAHIVAILEHLQDRCISGWPADSQLFHFLDQRGFRVARRRLSEMLLGLDRFLRWGRSFAHPWQALGLIIVAVVNSFFIERQIAWKEDDLPGRAKTGLTCAVREFDRRAL